VQTGLGVQFHYLKDQETEEEAMAGWVADRRLYLDENDQLVDELEPGRKTLLAAKGRIVPDAMCRRYGLGIYAPDLPVEGPASDASTGADPAGEDPGTDGESADPGAGLDPESGDDAQPDSPHRHRYRADSTCKCGATREE